jgi:hypothetical protein
MVLNDREEKLSNEISKMSQTILNKILETRSKKSKDDIETHNFIVNVIACMFSMYLVGYIKKDSREHILEVIFSKVIENIEVNQDARSSN